MKELKMTVEFSGHELEDGTGIIGSGRVVGGGNSDQIEAMVRCIIQTMAEALYKSYREQLPEDGGENAALACIMRVFDNVHGALDEFLEEQEGVSAAKFWELVDHIIDTGREEAERGKVS